MKVEKNDLKNRRCFFTSAKGIFNGALLLSLLFFSGACSNSFDDYYERPGWLDKDAYEGRKNKGNFTHYLKLVDRTLYAKVLHGSGSYTFFAPNDEAFAIYLAANNYQTVNDIPLSKATDIVAYSLVYNQYAGANLGDVWTSSSTWNTGMSVRKMTPSYKNIYKYLVNGYPVYVYDDYTSIFSDTRHDNRYLPIFTPAYFASNSLSSSDYAQFYTTPWITYSNV